MLDQITISVADYPTSKAFYLRALAPLGYGIIMEYEHMAGFGTKDKPEFWIKEGGSTSPAVHVAFGCPDTAKVDAFYEAAIAAGGRSHGAPAQRPEFHKNYYGASVLDPDDNNVEAVCHESFIDGAL